MSCSHVHDFITGTTITLPHAIHSQSADREGWDILHQNEKAATLVARHIEALNALNIKRMREAPIG